MAEPIDFSDDDLQQLQIKTNAYDSRPSVDSARKYIAFTLIGALLVFIVAALLLIAFGVVKVEELDKFSSIYTPLIGLVSSVTAFYYGQKT